MKFFKINFKIVFCLVLIGHGILLFSCKEDEIIPGISDQYLAYLPLMQGHWVEYNADSIVHLDIDDVYYLDTAIRTYSFQIREEIDSSFYDAEGDLAWRISRYRRSTGSDPWVFMNLWTAKVKQSSAQRVEDNIRFIKLSFPLDSREDWDGNAFNNYPVEEYYYEDIHESKTYGSLFFDSTLVVVQNEFISSINRIDKKEIYAKNAGMVYKVLDSLNTVNLPNGSTVILNGTEYKLEISNYKR